MKRRADQGSALLIAVVVVVLAVGIGGAFVAESLYHSNAQKVTTDQDELMAMCDAGMERAKQALDMYRGYAPQGWVAPAGYVAPTGLDAFGLPNMPWNWDDVITYCYQAVQNDANIPTQYKTDLTNNWWLPPDAAAIKASAMSAMKSSGWKPYSGTIAWQAGSSAFLGVNTPRAELTMPPLGYQTNPQSSHAYPYTFPNNKVFFGWNTPFGKGAIHVYVHNNQGIQLDQRTGVALAGPQPEIRNQDRDFTVCITVTATLPNGLQRQVEATLRRPVPPPPYVGPQFAAVTSQDTVQTLGNVSIDGRDWNDTGTSVVGAGTYGILSTKDITIGGSSAVGGSGSAPPGKGAAAGSTKSFGSSTFPSGYPSTPDAVMNLAPGQLKTAAISSGTYFNSEAAYTAAMPAGGWSGKIVYADFDPSPSFNIGGSAYNAQPTLLIVQNDTGTASIKNSKGYFKGLLIADELNHTSAPGSTLGAEFLLSPTASSGANAFGSGNTPIMFSSAVLNNLPPLSNPNAIPSQQLSYRRVQ